MSDLISRQAAIDGVHHAVYKFFDIVEDDDESPITYNDKRLLELNKTITSRLKELPPADRPTGKWINREYCQVDEDSYEVAICSECGAEVTIEYPYDGYCPNCGTKMDV